MSVVQVDFSGIGLRVAGLDDSMAGRLREDWRRFVAQATGTPLLHVAVSFEDRDVAAEPFRPKEMTSEFEASSARFAMPQGRCEAQDDGSASIVLASNLDAIGYFTMMNLLRACLAWRLPAVGAALLHAAGLVVEQRAYALVGPEGSGKTTWASVGEAHGARLLSDDLVLVQCGAAGVEALGSPFRSSLRRDYRPGRWPLAALLFPRRGTHARWTACPAMRSRAMLAANLPFVSSALEADERVGELIERLVTGVPCRELTFAPEPSFLELLQSDEAPGV
jgi:hypothetical protein